MSFLLLVLCASTALGKEPLNHRLDFENKMEVIFSSGDIHMREMFQKMPDNKIASGEVYYEKGKFDEASKALNSADLKINNDYHDCEEFEIIYHFFPKKVRSKFKQPAVERLWYKKTNIFFVCTDCDISARQTVTKLYKSALNDYCKLKK